VGSNPAAPARKNAKQSASRPTIRPILFESDGLLAEIDRDTREALGEAITQPTILVIVAK
jgi:hypothetical protein